MQRDTPYLFVFSPNAGKSGPEIAPQGYDQKRKLFRTNSFVLAHSSAKKIYIEQFGFDVVECFLMVRISELECCFANAIINFCFWIFFVCCDTCLV